MDYSDRAEHQRRIDRDDLISRHAGLLQSLVPSSASRLSSRTYPAPMGISAPPIILVAKSPMVFAANPKSSIGSLQDVIAYAKAKSGQQKRSGTQMTYVHYRGVASRRPMPSAAKST